MQLVTCAIFSAFTPGESGTGTTITTPRAQSQNCGQLQKRARLWCYSYQPITSTRGVPIPLRNVIVKALSGHTSDIAAAYTDTEHSMVLTFRVHYIRIKSVIFTLAGLNY